MTIAKTPEYTPDQIEKMLADYEELEKTADDAEEKRAAEEARLLPIVRRNGDKHGKASQSFLLRGKSHEALATYSFSNNTNQDAIRELLAYMREQKLLRYFRRMFESKLTFTKVSTALTVLMEAKLDEATLTTVTNLFGACSSSTPQKPKLKVTLVKPIPVPKAKPAKKARGGKVAA